MKKKILLALIFVVASSLCFASVDIELPLDCILATTDGEISTSNSSSNFFPYLPLGHFRANYVFDDFTQNSWDFALGASCVLWPLQVYAVSASAFYTLCNLNDGATFELVNILDVGILCFPYGYYDVDEGKNVSQIYCGPAFGYCLNFYYRNPNLKGFYFGFGPDFSFAALNGEFFILYSVNFTLGWRIPTRTN